MKLHRIFHFIILIVLVAGCKKPKPVTFSGQLLLTKKYPIALSNTPIEIYQAGSASAIGIASGSSSSKATTSTDANGFFKVNFTPGTSTFILFSGASTKPLTLSSALGDTSRYRFARRNFPDSLYDNTKPIFVAKNIETAIIKTYLLSNLTTTDTIGLRAGTLNGNIDKEYTGLTGAAGSIIVLDTITNLLFTEYDCIQKIFANNLYVGRKFATGQGYTFISSYGVVLPTQLSAEDEVSRELLFYFKK